MHKKHQIVETKIAYWPGKENFLYLSSASRRFSFPQCDVFCASPTASFSRYYKHLFATKFNLAKKHPGRVFEVSRGTKIILESPVSRTVNDVFSHVRKSSLRRSRSPLRDGNQEHGTPFYEFS